MRVVHLQDIPERIREGFDASLREAGFDATWAGQNEDRALPEIASGAGALLTSRRRIGRQLLEVPGLRLVQVTGRAPWAVDWEAAHEVGVPVSVLPHGGAVAVAEQAIALMLGSYRMLVEGHQGTLNGAYQARGVDPVRTSERIISFNWLGFDSVRQLYGKRLGLVGFGDIGIEVARRAQSFDMEVVYFKRTPLPESYAAMAGVRAVPLDELLATSDIVSLHVPHTDATEGMIDAAALAAMKTDSILVNTARGGLVDERALVETLRTGGIAGAGLDAFVDEPLPVGHPLTDCPNVLFSPHIGGGTGGGQRGMIRGVVENLERLEAGETPLGLVGPDGSPLEGGSLVGRDA